MGYESPRKGAPLLRRGEGRWLSRLGGHGANEKGQREGNNSRRPCFDEAPLPEDRWNTTPPIRGRARESLGQPVASPNATRREIEKTAAKPNPRAVSC